MSIYKTNSFETVMYFLIKDEIFLEKDNKNLRISLQYH